MPSIYNFVRQGTVSLLPENTHLVFESSYDSDYCYFVNSANKKQLIKMNMTDRSTEVIETRTNKDIARGFLDRNTDEIYFVDCDYDQSWAYVWKIDLSDDSVSELYDRGLTDIFDIWRYDSETYVLYHEYVYVGPDPVEILIAIHNIDLASVFAHNMGVFAGRSWKVSQIVLIGDQAWFLFKWSNENVELWKADIGDTSLTEMEDLGSSTELPVVQQGAIAYDDSDILYFIIGEGTAEVSTIVADVPGNIDDGDYITYSAIELDYEHERSEKDFYIWFDKVGDESGDPAPADRTKITVDISGSVTAQDVSDAIQAAVDGTDLITCANGGGTSTTCTLTCHYNGNTTNIADVDSGLAVATITPGVANTYYLYTYGITDDDLTDTGLEYNIALMLNRNTNSSNTPECFALEKAFEVTITAAYEAKLYQISRTRGALNFLGQITLVSGAYIIAITDYYLFLYDGSDYYLWKYQDIMLTQIAQCDIHAKVRTWYEMAIQILDFGAGYQDPPIRDQFIQSFGTYTSYTLGGTYTETNHLLAEGLVRTHDLKETRNLEVKSLVMEELKNISPNISDYTNYTGKTSGQIIDQLIDDYCKTIQPGTISNGSTPWTCPDDWKAQGDKSLEQIFNELADTEQFQWYLRPDNLLDFNDGTVDSQQTFATTDIYWDPDAKLLSQNINQIELMGGFVDGTQIGPVTSDDLKHQQLYGDIVKWSKTYASVLDATILQTIADAKLNLQGAAPLIYWADRKVSTDWGFIQVGELITCQALKVDPDSTKTLTAGDYILDENTYDAKDGTSDLKLTDGMLFQENASLNLPEQNSQLIQQLGATEADVITRIPRTSSNLASNKWYYGSAGFNYETVGTTGTSIDWVDTDSLSNAEIITEYLNHKNVLTVIGTAGADPYVYHNLTQATAGIFECWIAAEDVSDDIYLSLSESGNDRIVRIRFHNDDLEYIDSGDVWQKIDDVSDATFYHIKIRWYADNTFDLYLDGTLEVDGVACNNNQVSGINRVEIIYASDNTNIFYLDAVGIVGEVDPQGYTYLEGGNYNYKDVVEALEAIGVKNKKTRQCILEGSTDNTFHQLLTGATYSNVGADDFTLTFGVPLDPTKGAKKLYIDAIIIGVEDADAGDYIDNAYLKKWTAYGTSSTKQTDATNRTSAAEVEFSFTAEDLSDAKRIVVQIDIVATDPNDLDISYVLVQYYYDN